MAKESDVVYLSLGGKIYRIFAITVALTYAIGMIGVVLRLCRVI